MNILILSWRGLGHPNAGGAEISTHEHAKRWVKLGHSVTLFTSEYVNCKKKEFLDGISIIRNGKQFFDVQWKAFCWYLFGNHPKYNLVIDQFHGIPFFTPLYIREKKLAFIHEVTKEVWKLNPWPRPYNLMASTIGRFLEPLIFKIFYKSIPFMTVSNSTKRDLIEWGIFSKNITVIHNGISAYRFKERPTKESKKTIVFLGSLNKDKGIEDALNVFSIINKNETNYQFWIIGKSETSYLKYLKKIVKENSLKYKAKFWGMVSEKDKFSLLARAHLLVNPSIREGWGLVVIEAASVGIPTVGYNVAGLRDSIINNKTGILCRPDIVSCANSIMMLLSKRKKYEKMTTECKKWAKKFDWDQASQESLRLIKNITAEP